MNEKLKSDVSQRKEQLSSFEMKVKTNSDEILRLTKEISDAQTTIGKLKLEVIEQENKLNKNKKGYQIACQAMINNILSDIQKIQSTI